MSDAAVAAASPAVQPKLDQLMLAMDVVDTIRHQEAVIARELGQHDRDEALKLRLRSLYESQGLAVTDEILDAGIKALKESRFAYTPPPPGLARTLAYLWIDRRRVGGITAAVSGLFLLLVAFFLWQGSVDRQRAEDTRIAIEETLPRDLQTAAQIASTAAAASPAGLAQIAAFVTDGSAALARGDAAGARAAITGLSTLTASLNATYQLRIVQGVWREPLSNSGVQSFYLIVEAVAPDGRLVNVPITSEETGQTRTVNRWGVRVTSAIYNAVAADATDDDIIENNVLGTKPRGQLEVSYAMPVLGGTILSW